jgi:hypothetical protein
MSDRMGWAAHGLMLLATISPILVSGYVPLVDLPNNISRVAILSHLQQSADLQKFYSYDWHFVPDLAFDIFVLFVGRIVGIMVAAKLFCVMAASSLYIGTVLLHRTLHGRFSVVPAAAAVLVYNGPFLYGFLNYVLGVGVALFAVSAWIAWRNLPLRIHAPIFFAVGLFVMSVHLYGYGLFGVTIFGIEIGRAFRAWRRGAGLALSLAGSLMVGIAPALPTVIFFAISPTESGIDRNVLSSLHWKADALAEPLLFYFTLPEIIVACGFVLVFGALLLTRRLAVNAAMTAALGLLVIVFLLMPRTALSSGFADYRMPAAIALFVLASLDWSARAGRAAVGIGSVAIVVLAIGKIATIGAAWVSWQPALAAYSAAFERLPPGAVLLPVEGSTGSTSKDRRPPVLHMATLAAARGVFVPTLLGDDPAFLLHFRRPYLELKHMGEVNPQWADDLRRFPSRYTHLLINRPEFVEIPPDIHCQDIASGPTFVLCRLVPRSP